MTVQCMCEQPGTPCPKHPETTVPVEQAPVVAPQLHPTWVAVPPRVLTELAPGVTVYMDVDHPRLMRWTGERVEVSGSQSAPQMVVDVGAVTYDTLTELRAAPSDPDRDARREAYREAQRRRAARALDRYMVATGYLGEAFPAAQAASERFVESVGDYVLSRLHHNGDYGVTEPRAADHRYDADRPGVPCQVILSGLDPESVCGRSESQHETSAWRGCAPDCEGVADA